MKSSLVLQSMMFFLWDPRLFSLPGQKQVTSKDRYPFTQGVSKAMCSVFPQGEKHLESVRDGAVAERIWLIFNLPERAASNPQAKMPKGDQHKPMARWTDHCQWGHS